MGKLGSGELSADSDLDLIVVYEADAEQSEGRQPLEAPVWFARFAQRLVSALSAPTEEGLLYPVDLALRPSGSAGPVAVSLARFATYYADEAWVWERMAMTRARLVASNGEGDPVLKAVGDAVNGHTLSKAEVCEAARDMRARLERDKPAASSWDLKLRAGGLLDIEFVAQAGLVANRLGGEPATRRALERLADAGWLDAADARTLGDAHRLYEDVTQLTRLAHGSGFDPRDASEPFARRLARAGGCASLDELKDRVEASAAAVRAVFVRMIGKTAPASDG
jgi:glutamate-ammonia-ligase adenylyltransferase